MVEKLKVQKNIHDILGTLVGETPGKIEILTKDGYSILVQRLEKTSAEFVKPMQKKSLYGVFAHANVSMDDIEESKKIFHRDIEI